MMVGGRHPVIFVVRKDNDRTRDISKKGVVSAIRRLIAAGTPTKDELVVLNHWRKIHQVNFLESAPAHDRPGGHERSIHPPIAS